VNCECPGDDDLARIVVTDTGRGMSAEQQQRLFQRFERLGAEHTSVPGSGLGLVISRMMLEAMMGAIDISSEPGRGTTVTITLPLVR
jgi:signal transduction histidine kinase